jgi:uncharacterized protein with von Willebrand factor type A (vWA) domain
MKDRPEWLTPYWAAAEAYSGLCDKQEAKQNLKLFLDKADDSPAYKEAIEQAHKTLQAMRDDRGWLGSCN